MPCLPGFLPVHIEAQAVGVQAGIVERNVPQVPVSINFCKQGISAAVSNGSRYFQQAASSPTSNVFLTQPQLLRLIVVSIRLALANDAAW